MRRLAGWMVLLAAFPAFASDVDWSVRFLNRLDVQRSGLQTQILFDEVTRRFRAWDYLVPGVDQTFSTHALGLSVDAGLTAGLRFFANVDSGLLRIGEQYRQASFTLPVNGHRIPFSFPLTGKETVLTANGAPVTDEARRSLFLREAYFDYEPAPPVRLLVGKRHITLAEGFVFDQYTFAAGVRVEGAPGEETRRWRFSADAMVVDGSFDTGGKTSPLVSVGVDYLPGPLQHVGLRLLYFHDGNDVFSEVFRTAILEASVARANAGGRAPLLAVQAPFGSRGDVLWFGVSAKKFFRDHILEALALGQVGHVRATALLPSSTSAPPTLIDLDASAYGLLLDLAYRYDLTEDLALGGFFTFATGDDALAEGFRPNTRVDRISTFLSLFPFVTRASLFFNGGLNAEYTQRRASTLGVNARGVVAAGVFARLEKGPASAEGRVVVLGAPAPSLYDGRFYGVEMDWLGSWRFGRYLRAVTEVDVLWAGSFFGAARSIFQFIVGLDVLAP